MRRDLLILLFVTVQLFSNFSYSQENFAQNKFVNEKIQITNDILYAYNENVNNVKTFQNELKYWASEKKNNSVIPVLEVVEIPSPDIFYKSRHSKESLTFNYEFYLFRLNKYTKEFYQTCIKLQNLKFENNKQYSFEVGNCLYKIEKQTKFIAEIAIGLSRVCAINFKNDKYPRELLNIKEIVEHSKSLIHAIRSDNRNETSELNKKLNYSLLKAKSITTAKDLKNVAKIDININEIESKMNAISSKASNIKAWSEQYLQISEKTNNEKEVNQFLQLTIDEFNRTEDFFGSAYSFNQMIEGSEELYMMFVEEPSSIYIEEIKIPRYKKEIDTTKRKNQKFDNGVIVLESSMPYNIVFLMDVSSSMKKSAKFPLMLESIKHAIDIMSPSDKITLISYSGESKVLIAAATVNDKEKMYEILNTLKMSSGSGSDIDNALKKAYTIAENNFIENGNNKLIIASDGIFGVTSNISKMVKEKISVNLSLSVFHYGSKKDRVNSKTLKTLAHIGNGEYELIETSKGVKKSLMKEI